MVRTVNEMYIDIRHRLKKNGTSSASLEAREIMAFAMNVSVQELLRNQNLFLAEDTVNTIENLTERRLNGEPCAYIIGEWDFYSMKFKVSENTLIPRQDTETLIDKFLQVFPDKKREIRILDLCCGSGCIGIVLAEIYGNAKAVLIDNYEETLNVARQNAKLHNLKESVCIYKHDVFLGWDESMGKFDAIVSNPPYIKTSDIEKLDISVRFYEPHQALDGGDDGLSFYRAIADKWKNGLAENGMLITECGSGQASDVAKIMRSALFADVCSAKDYNGIERIVCGCNRVVDKK